MDKLKATISLIICGLSTFTIMPKTDYAKNLPKTPNEITELAWKQTGDALRQSIKTVGARIHGEATRTN